MGYVESKLGEFSFNAMRGGGRLIAAGLNRRQFEFKDKFMRALLIIEQETDGQMWAHIAVYLIKMDRPPTLWETVEIRNAIIGDVPCVMRIPTVQEGMKMPKEIVLMHHCLSKKNKIPKFNVEKIYHETCAGKIY